jgi:hypothetical protein
MCKMQQFFKLNFNHYFSILNKKIIKNFEPF